MNQPIQKQTSPDRSPTEEQLIDAQFTLIIGGLARLLERCRDFDTRTVASGNPHNLPLYLERLRTLLTDMLVDCNVALHDARQATTYIEDIGEYWRDINSAN